MDKSLTSAIPAVVLNLARAHDRRAHIERQLKGRGLRYQFFEAVDGLQLSSADEALHDQRRTLLFRRASMHKGHIACALSHIRIYEWMIQENLPRLLIMEDDVVLSDEFFVAIANANEWLPDGWDVINFSTAWSSVKGHPNLFRLGPKLCPLASLPNHALTYLMHPHAMAVCYLIHLKAAKFFASKSYPIRMTADRMTGWTEWHARHCYTILPFIANIAHLRSQIDAVPMHCPDSPYNAPPYPWTLRLHLKWREVIKVFRIAKHMLRTAWMYACFSVRYPMARQDIRMRVRVFVIGSPRYLWLRVCNWIRLFRQL